MPDPLRHVSALAGEIGPRRATTEGEARAARYLVTAARQFTHQVWVEPFRAFATPVWPWLLVLGVATVGGVSIWWEPWLATALTMLAALGMVGQAVGWIELGRLFPHKESQNVVAVVPCMADLRARLVLVAHYDTARVDPRPIPARRLRTAFLTVAACLLVLPAVSLLALALPGSLWAWFSVGPVAGVALGAIHLLLRYRHGVDEPGVLNNGCSLAALLRTGEWIAQRPLLHTEVWTLFTGCREPGLVGMHAFLDRHGLLLADAHFVVLDRVIPGAVQYGLGEGLLRLLMTERRLPELLQAGAGQAVPGTYLAQRQTEATAALSRGFKAMALVTPVDQGDFLFPAPEGEARPEINPADLDRLAQLLVGLAEQVDGQVSLPEEVEANA